MKRKLAIFILMVSGLVLIQCASDSSEQDTDILFQTKTIATLLEGDYDGNLTMKALNKHGDFGLGTFQALDGEMIVLNDTIYQVLYSGRIIQVNDSVKTPFAIITCFNSDKTWSIVENKDLAQLHRELNEKLRTISMIHAIRIDGTFPYVKTRSVPAQKKPYPRLAEAVKNQSIFELENIRGTIVGFRFPEYLNGINVPGYHFHFIDDSRTCGGHLLDCTIASGTMQIDVTDQFFLILPNEIENDKANVSGIHQEELDRIEKGK